jgi:type III restriction enzyme
MSFEVAEPILNSPYEEPAEHWVIHEGLEPERRQGRRLPVYYYRDPKAKPTEDGDDIGRLEELKLVSLLRERLAAWRKADYAGATRTTRDLLRWWRRDGQKQRLFFAQLEAVETVIFLNEARRDFRQGIAIASDEPSDDKKAEGYRAFRRLACKMGTGTGKTNVMAMLAAWSILNKVNDRTDARFSDVVLVVCPNVTIRSRLEELKPELGEGSLYAKRELVPPDLMPLLSRGRVLVTNWHVFELQSPSTSGARVMKAGVIEKRVETITIGEKTTTARGSRYMTRGVYEALVASGELRVVGEPETDADGNVSKVKVEASRYVESDKAFVNRVLGREVGGKQNIMVFNDEAHHAYRIRREEDDDEEELFGEEEEAEEFFKEATVWVDGLDRIHKLRGINLCVDLSATPYFLGRVGQDTNRPFPWVVSDFGLVEAIESGLVKIPQFAIRDTSGAEFAQYFNVWEWVMAQLSKGERGGKRTNPKPEAILKYAANPITLLAGDWQEDLRKWERERKDPRPPVFIVVCKTTQLAKVVYEWLAEDKAPSGVAPCKIEGFRPAADGTKRAIRVDTKVVNETDAEQTSSAAKSEEGRWMRFTLDTVGKIAWPTDRQARPIYPEGFEELAVKLGRPLHPPGRDVRCIVSVAMLTEGWDCSTVTHVVGLRPFMSQLLCEQVVGRALRRISYDVGSDGKLGEEIAQVFGVPFHMVPFKAQKQAAPRETPSKTHIHALPGRAQYRIVFPRVEGYVQFIRDRVTVDWETTAPLVLDPGSIPPEAQMKAGMYSEKGHLTLNGPGDLETLSMNPFRKGRRLQELKFDIARALTQRLGTQATCRLPVHVLFPQILGIVSRYLDEKVHARPPAEKVDVFVSPYFDWVIERLSEAIHSHGEGGETIERPVYEKSRGPGSTDEISFWTMRDTRPVVKSHVAFVVADTQKWEQQAAYYLDTDKRVEAFVKNAGMGFAIPYFHNGQPHEYVPDFIVRLVGQPTVHLVLETKGYDPLADVKIQAAKRWVDAVNADGRHGTWRYEMVREVTEIPKVLGRGL